MLDGVVYVAPEGYEEELARELGSDASRLSHSLFFAPGPRRRIAWAANVWLDPVEIPLDALAGLGVNLHELGAPSREPALGFPPRMPREPIGAWALIRPNTIIAATRTSRPFAQGAPHFLGDKKGPPSRAYFKLWEALTLMGRWPRAGERCVDLGSSPGGWTWALERLGAHVLSVDKAPLDPRVAKLRRVEFRRMSAFALDPASVPRVDWVVSDVICYPTRTVALVERWLRAHPRARFVVTVKFQGETDMSSLEPLREIPGSELLHLHYNKHELTWLKA